MSVRKSQLSGSNAGSYFSPFVVHTYRGVIAVFNVVFRSTMSCSRPEIFAIKARNPKFWCFWVPKFLGWGTPKFLTQFKKLQSLPNMWQSLVTTGPETSETRRRKKKKVSKMIETSAVKYNGRRPASWRAAITTLLWVYLKPKLRTTLYVGHWMYCHIVHLNDRCSRVVYSTHYKLAASGWSSHREVFVNCRRRQQELDLTLYQHQPTYCQTLRLTELNLELWCY